MAAILDLVNFRRFKELEKMQSPFFLITTMFQMGISKKITFNKHFARKYIRAYTKWFRIRFFYLTWSQSAHSLSCRPYRWLLVYTDKRKYDWHWGWIITSLRSKSAENFLRFEFYNVNLQVVLWLSGLGRRHIGDHLVEIGGGGFVGDHSPFCMRQVGD